jgi:hypothetical protein
MRTALLLASTATGAAVLALLFLRTVPAGTAPVPLARDGATTPDLPLPPDLAGPVPPRPPADETPEEEFWKRKQGLGMTTVLHVELERADGKEEEITAGACRPERALETLGTFLEPQVGPTLYVHPGDLLMIRTDDPRAAVVVLTARVPDPAPADLTVRVPSRGDPRLDRLVLRVLDDGTGQPLADAVLAWGADDAPSPLQHGDADGRIVPAPPPGKRVSALEAFLQTAHVITAPGHRSLGRPLPPVPDWRFRPDAALCPTSASLERFLADGVLEVRLKALPQ